MNTELWFVLLCFLNIQERHMYCFTLHSIVELLLRFLQEPITSAVLPQAGWKAYWFLQDWTTVAGLYYNIALNIAGFWKKWTIAAGLWGGDCLPRGLDCNWSIGFEFAMGLNCCQRKWSSHSKNYCWTGPLIPWPNNFCLLLSLLSGGLEERMNPC